MFRIDRSCRLCAGGLGLVCVCVCLPNTPRSQPWWPTRDLTTLWWPASGRRAASRATRWRSSATTCRCIWRTTWETEMLWRNWVGEEENCLCYSWVMWCRISVINRKPWLLRHRKFPSQSNVTLIWSYCTFACYEMMYDQFETNLGNTFCPHWPNLGDISLNEAPQQTWYDKWLWISSAL